MAKRFAPGYWFGLAMVAAATAVLLACAQDDPAPPPQAAVVPDEVLASAPHLGRPDDGYVGAAACERCHEDQHASWHRSYHRTMTQLATDASVRGPFDNVTLKSRRRTYKLTRVPTPAGSSFFVDMVDPTWDRQQRAIHGERVDLDRLPNQPNVTRRVVMTTGSHYMQTCWVESEGPERQQELLPFMYLFEDERWVPREDVFLFPPDAARMIPLWNDNCIRCHSTAGQPRRRSTGRFDTRVAELGISCEMCHGPGAEHVAFHERSENEGAAAHAIVHPLALSTVRGSQICGQCHAITGPPSAASDETWFAIGYPYKPGDDLFATRGITRHHKNTGDKGPRVPKDDFLVARSHEDSFFWRDGMIRVSGREYNGLIESACYRKGEMTCFSCHSMHESEPHQQLAEDKKGDEACLQCHAAIGADVSAHTHHGAESSGSRCYNCHMPHTTYGLLKAIRSHQISSPDVRESLGEVGRPNACNLCHLDKTLEWTGDHLANWYGHEKPDLGKPDSYWRTYAASVLWLVRGDAGQRVLSAWHMGWPEAQAISGDDWMAPLLSTTIAADPYAAVRYVAGRSLRSLKPFEDLRYDYIAPEFERTRVGQDVYRRWHELAGGMNTKRPDLLLTKDGLLDFAAHKDLTDRRDNRPLFLAE